MYIETEKLRRGKFHLHILKFYLGFLLASFLHNFAWFGRSTYLVQVCKRMYITVYSICELFVISDNGKVHWKVITRKTDNLFASFNYWHIFGVIVLCAI